MRLRNILLLLAAAAFMFGCQESGNNSQNDIPVDTVAESTDATVDDVEIMENTTFKLPSPVELYLFLWEEDADFAKSFLNPTENVTKYFTTSSKALNFGIYASDLAYCTVFGQNQETFLYFTTVKQLADEMAQSEVLDAKVEQQIEENLNNKDSLYEITTSSYADATNFLENQKQGNLLPFILTGAWIESVHIAINTVEEFSENNEIIIRVAEQQFLLENLLDYISSIKDKNEDMKKLEESLLNLQSIYDQLYDNTDVIITKKQYQDITTEIETLRNAFIS